MLQTMTRNRHCEHIGSGVVGHDISDESFQRLDGVFLCDNLNWLAYGWVLDRFELCPYLLN